MDSRTSPYPSEFGRSSILLHPIAFAAWVGLFVAFLNLLPFGQFDGGHILHALSERVQRWAGPLLLLALVPMGVLWWGWWLWACLAVSLSRGRLGHLRVVQPQVQLKTGRRIVGGLAILIFLLTVVPVPVRL